MASATNWSLGEGRSVRGTRLIKKASKTALSVIKGRKDGDVLGPRLPYQKKD